MSTPKKRRPWFVALALVALTLGTVVASAPTASAQYGFGRGGYSNRGYGGSRPGFYNRGYGYGGFNRGLNLNIGGFGPGIYNRGYGGFGPGIYGGGYYGAYPAPLASPIGVPNYGYGTYGGYY